MTKIIAVDMDEVLCETLDALLEKWNNKMNNVYIEKHEFHSYDWNEVEKLNLTREEAIDVYRDFMDEDKHESIKPVKWAKEKLLELKGKWYKLFVVTARPEHQKDITTQWLNKYFEDMFDDIIFACYDLKWIRKNKSEICKDIWADIMIEDNLHYSIDTSNSGVLTYIIDKPWNKRYCPIEHIDIKKVSGWHEIDI